MIYDDNHITIDGDTALTLLRGRAAAASRPTAGTSSQVGDGNDLAAIDEALDAAAAPRPAGRRSSSSGPYIADPAPTKRNTAEAHGAPLGAEEVRRTKEILGWPTEPAFFVPGRRAGALARRAWSGARRIEAEWRGALAAYAADHAELAAEFEQLAVGHASRGLGPRRCRSSRPAAASWPPGRRPGWRSRRIAAAVPNLVGGSADLGGSTGTTLKQGGTFGPTTSGRTSSTGACASMAWRASLNGIAAHGGLRPFGSTFLVFSDYMKPAIRLAAIMRLPVIYIGTHDSIGVGEDGPTHQPVEHLAMLRAIPNLVVLRPATPPRRSRPGASAMAAARRPDDAGADAGRSCRCSIATTLGPAEGVRRGGVRAARPAGRRARRRS